MSYFQKHHLKISQAQQQTQNIPKNSIKTKKNHSRIKTEAQQQNLIPFRHRQPQQNFVAPKKKVFTSNNIKKTQQKIPTQYNMPMQNNQSSVQELLNSSINQFTKYLSDRESFQQQHQQLVAQNQSLKVALEHLKQIMRGKLQKALNAQKNQLNTVMQDYVQLITKLLADKGQLSSKNEQLEQKYKQQVNKYEKLQKSYKQLNLKTQKITKQKQQHIQRTKQQIQQFLKIIQQYDEESEKQNEQKQLLKTKILQLEEQLEKKQNQNISEKTQSLIQLLQNAQEQNRILREELRSKSTQQLNNKIQNLEKQHQLQFIQYQNAVKQTLKKKDQCIARLNSIIQSQRLNRQTDQRKTITNQ